MILHKHFIWNHICHKSYLDHIRRTLVSCQWHKHNSTVSGLANAVENIANINMTWGDLYTIIKVLTCRCGGTFIKICLSWFYLIKNFCLWIRNLRKESRALIIFPFQKHLEQKFWKKWLTKFKCDTFCYVQESNARSWPANIA